MLDVARELDRSGFGEENTVARSQAADLALIVGTVVGILAGFIHETVPHIDVGDAGALGAGAIEFVEVGRLARGASAAN